MRKMILINGLPSEMVVEDWPCEALQCMVLPTAW